MPLDPALGVPASRVGDYVVGRRIGAGGMAVVDVAARSGAAGGRLVALKRIAALFSNDPSARRMFLREASIVTRLEHPNVVRTYEVGEVAGEAFIAMELLEGATVSQLQHATEERFPIAVALRIVRDALRGLHAAHELCALGGKALGLIHQDVSPQNIHLAYEGTTRILDFGVARLTAVDASRTDSVRGKACYLAPEQLTLGSIDRRADIFAMGIVLHELLTGSHLFPRSPPDAAYAAILSGDLRPPRTTHPDVPPEVDAVVMRALARAPADRFATAEEMRLALAAAQEQAAVAEIDVASLGAWAARVVPAAWTRAEIELEVAEGRDASGARETPGYEATLPPRKVGAVAEASVEETHAALSTGAAKGNAPSRRRLAPVVALFSVVAVGVAAVALGRGGTKPVDLPPASPGVSEQVALPLPASVATEGERVVPAPASEPVAAPKEPARGSPPAASAVLRKRPRPAVAASAAPSAAALAAEPSATSSALPAKKADVYDQM
jgi:hypothetical protein